MATTISHRSGIDLSLLARPDIQKVMSEINNLSPGTGQILAIHGDSGTGKSSLARSILRHIRGWSAYSMTATAGMGTDDLVERINLVVTESESENASGEVDVVESSAVASISPSAAANAAANKDPVPEDFGTVLEWMVHLIDVPFASTLIHIDDAHLLEESTVHALAAALSTLEDGRFIALMTGASNAPYLSYASDTAQVTLMTAEEIQTFALSDIGARISLDLAERIQSMSGGYLGRVHELLTALPADSWNRRNVTVQVPQQWIKRWEEKSQGLSPETLMALQALACIEEVATLDLLEHMVGTEGVDEALEPAINAGIVSVIAGVFPPVLQFSAVEDKSTVGGMVGPARRRAFHKGAHKYYDARGDKAQALVHRALGISSHDEDIATELAEAAEGLGNAGRWKEAADFYQLAAEISATKAQQHKYELNHLEALVASSNIRAVAHRARTLDTRAPNMWRDSLLGFLAIHQGRRIEATSRFNNAVLDREAPDDVRAQLASRKALAEIANWNPQGVIDAAADAAKWGGPQSEPALSAGYIATVAQSALTGKNVEMPAQPGESQVLAQRRHMALGWIKLANDDPISARQELQQLPREEGATRIDLWQIAWLARAEFLLGEWDDAIATVEKGLFQSDYYGIDLLDPLLLWTGAIIAQLRGSYSIAANYRNRLVIGNDAFTIQRVPAAITRMVTGLRENQMLEATRAADQLIEMDKQTSISQPGFWPWRDLAVNVLLNTKRLEEADELLSVAEEDADRVKNFGLQARLVADRAHQALVLGESDRGVKLYEQAIEMMATSHMRPYQGRTLFAFGQALRRLGRRRQADGYLASAAEIYQSMGAHAHVEKINRERRAGGLGPRQNSASSLTTQELEVAQHAASGLTNKEIAAQLFLSPKTVEFHLTRIYRKLRIRTRTELPAALTQALRE
ncbi:LuxR C-terminal-related transcriptional regulator [Corynebacterium casei]|uniref:LuxR C-terminal-related transcriptional regulator n=3 Tax=Corynebacterium casei TaxID=160386 RepID=UPI001865ED83|nr:LuxR C-terminal-related transcriptional regulator [Corynebacterium casei]